MTVSRAGVKIAQDQVLFEGARLRDHFSGAVHRKTGSIKHQLVVAAHLIDIHDRLSVTPSGGPIYVSPDGTFAHVIRRCVDADQHLRTSLEQFFYWIALVEALLPETAVVPG